MGTLSRLLLWNCLLYTVWTEAQAPVPSNLGSSPALGINSMIVGIPVMPLSFSFLLKTR